MLKHRMILFTALLALCFSTQAAYECTGVDDCQQRWWRAMSWLQDNAKFKVVLKQENLLEAKARTPAHKNRLEYSVEKQALDNDRWLITASASCRIATGCPSTQKKLDKLFVYIAAPLTAQKARAANGDSAQGNGLSPIEQHISKQGCAADSPVHELRVSWAGQLFEVECIKGAAQREPLVVRCRVDQCHSLR